MRRISNLLARIQKQPREGGQVLVLTALAGSVLVAFLALVLDVGNLYLERRNAQNAADAAALVGAQDYAGVVPDVTIVAPNAVRDARRYAIQNGFVTDSGANNGTWNGEVRVDVPPATGPNAGKADHIEVQIHRQVHGFFTGMLGINLQVLARAVARAKHMSFDAATISLDTSNTSTWVHGTPSVVVVGNVYSRGGITDSGNSNLEVEGYAYARGGFFGNPPDAKALITNIPDLLDPKWPAPTALPDPGLSFNANIGDHPCNPPDPVNMCIYPGTYDYIEINTGQPIRFEPGVYRTTKSQGVQFTSSANAFSTGPVAFVVDSPGSFDVAGGATLNLYTSKSLSNGILIWTSATGNAVKINGGSNVTLGGTIYAPNASASIGGSAGGTVHGQVVAKDVELDGTSGTAVVYDRNGAPDTPGPTLVE